MRRGLISWSKAELPPGVLEARVARTQAAMTLAGVDALAIYSDPSRSAGASWLTAFVPYWNRGLVVLTRGGKPVLFTGMSNRVHGWIRANAQLESVNYSTRLGADAATFILAKKADAVVAVPCLTTVPGTVVEELGAAGATVIDGTVLIEGARMPPDPAELAFYFKAAEIARAGLAAASLKAKDAAALVGAVEGEARRRGAEEIYVALAPDFDKRRSLYRLEGNAALGARVALRASVAYKGTWVRMARTLAPDGTGGAAERFGAAVAALPRTEALAAFPSWSVEGLRATQPLEPFAGSMLGDAIPVAPGTVVTAQAIIEDAGGPVLIGAPVLVGRAGEAASALVAPAFD